MAKENIKVLYSSDEAARKITVTGWLSRNKHFYGDNEHLARWDGCTHLMCECGKERAKTWTKCESCRRKSEQERFERMPFKEWDGEEPICLFMPDEDEYFFSEEDLLEWCENNETEPDMLRLVICEPNRPQQISYDYWSDSLPGEAEAEDIFSMEFIEKLKELNQIIKDHEPISWRQGKFRTSYKPEKSPS